MFHGEVRYPCMVNLCTIFSVFYTNVKCTEVRCDPWTRSRAEISTGGRRWGTPTPDQWERTVLVLRRQKVSGIKTPHWKASCPSPLLFALLFESLFSILFDSLTFDPLRRLARLQQPSRFILRPPPAPLQLLTSRRISRRTNRSQVQPFFHKPGVLKFLLTHIKTLFTYRC